MLVQNSLSEVVCSDCRQFGEGRLRKHQPVLYQIQDKCWDQASTSSHSSLTGPVCYPQGHVPAHTRTAPPAALHGAVLTEKLMEDPSNGAVPLTLEERQPCRGHCILVLSVEVKRAEGSHLEAVAGKKTQAPEAR